MQVSKRFLALLKQQLAQFADRPDLRMLVVYAALPSANGEPSLLSIGEWPQPALALQNGMSEPAPAPGSTRRWLALRDGPLLLGALRIDTDCWPWPALTWLTSISPSTETANNGTGTQNHLGKRRQQA